MSSQKPPVGAYVMIGGGIALAVGSFLPWIKVTAPLLGTATKAGTDGGGDGWLTLLAGAIAVVLGVVAINGAGAKAATRTGIVFGILVGALVIFEFADVNDRINSVDGEMVAADFGVGLFLCAAGAIAVFIGSMIAANLVDELEDERMLAEEFG